MPIVWMNSRKSLTSSIQGLIPRARLLLSLGGTFFLAFWPLIIVTVVTFAVLYLVSSLSVPLLCAFNFLDN